MRASELLANIFSLGPPVEMVCLVREWTLTGAKSAQRRERVPAACRCADEQKRVRQGFGLSEKCFAASIRLNVMNRKRLRKAILTQAPRSVFHRKDVDRPFLDMAKAAFKPDVGRGTGEGSLCDG